MDNKEIILSKIAEILSRKGFFFRSNSEFKSRLKCCLLYTSDAADDHNSV